MYLKGIEIQGFKSFANKINFEFHDGITGIVGPNGSGKSNIADALRWVLGEQRVKQLRGGNMQDVIFSGTQSRSPQSYAKVALCLDNSDHTLPIDFSEIIVARKLYRSGESEYMINGAPCRLKDVQELFFDTGIGKEGYSIIGQGQIDKILSGKPEERRELFDEAVGIVKFKKRKLQTQRKLESEQANLVRLNDILEELKRQVGPLKYQSEKAKDYLKYKDELKTLDINMFLLDIENAHNEQDKLEEKLKIAKKQFEEVDKNIEDFKTNYDETEEEIESLTFEIEDDKEQLSKSIILKEQIEGKIKLIEEQIKTQDLQNEHIKETTDTIKSEITKRVSQKQKIEFENKDLKQVLDNAIVEKEACEKNLSRLKEEISQNNENLENNNNIIIEELNRRTLVAGNAERFDVLIEQNKKEKSEINRKIIDVKSKQDELIARLGEKQDKLNKISQELNEKKDIYQNQKKDILDIQKTIKNLEGLYLKAQNEYHIENSRLSVLKNTAERYEGYGNSIKRVMQLKEKEKNIKGVVADIIKINKKYELAIEIALGSAIQNIVVENEETAKKLILYLKSNKFGRATFLPISSIKSRFEFSEKRALDEKGVVGIASELVEVASEFKELAKSLLGRILVVENIDNAIFISKKYGNKFKIVTIDGEIINPGGAMTGGAYKNSSNLLSRRREIQELEKSVKNAYEELQDIVERKEKALSSQKSIQEFLEKLAVETQKLELEKKEASLRVEDLYLKIKEQKQEIENLENTSENLDTEIENIKKDKLNIKDVLNKSKADEQKAHKLIEELERNNSKLEEELEKCIKENEEITLKYSTINQKYEFISNDLKRIEEEIKGYEKKLEETIFNNQNSSQIKSDKQLEIEKLTNSIKDAKELKEELELEIKEKEKEKEILVLKHKKSLDAKENLLKEKNDLDKEIFRLNSHIQGYEEGLENQINYMWEEYQLTYDSAKELRNDEFNNLNEMRKQVNKLKQDIKNLGPVNVNAIEDYKEVGQRYDFLVAQHEDLVKAQETLENIIKELDDGMKKQFKEKFAAINEEYNKVFKNLFGGGKGTLELIDDSDLLETGIKIIAQPPGKRLQNMMQLSGGEKALAAIALLFAIQNLKPSPFCLLDEIEATLDDSNVVKFARYLKDMTKYTQFIVITHRRGTMNEADRLYGITMQEKGVSTLVSVDLVEREIKN